MTPRRTLFVAGLAHALHDGFTDTMYVLLPVWQAEFALSYGMLAVLRGLYSGTIGSGALSPVLYGVLGDAAGVPWATLAAALTALGTIPLALPLAPRIAPTHIVELRTTG